MKENSPILNGAKANWRAPEFLACGDEPADVIGGLKTHRGRDHSGGWAGIIHVNRDYSTEVNLAPGRALENTWDPMPEAWYWAGQKIAPAHTCSGHKDTRNDPGFGLVLEPYILTKAKGQATGADRLEVSVDGGKAFKDAQWSPTLTCVQKVFAAKDLPATFTNRGEFAHDLPLGSWRRLAKSAKADKTDFVPDSAYQALSTSIIWRRRP